MKRMFLPAVLASATLMASDVENSEIQKRMADLCDCDLYSLMRGAQHYYHDRIKRLHAQDEQECVRSKMKLAACCYLLKEECEATKLWEEVLELRPYYREAQVNLKELYYRYAIEQYDMAARPGLMSTTRYCCILIGKDYAHDALEPSELYTLDQEKIKELTERFGLKVELNQKEKKLLGIQVESESE